MDETRATLLRKVEELTKLVAAQSFKMVPVEDNICAVLDAQSAKLAEFQGACEGVRTGDRWARFPAPGCRQEFDAISANRQTCPDASQRKGPVSDVGGDKFGPFSCDQLL